MPKLPLELQLTLRSGTVYKTQHRDLSSNLPHYLVVVNLEPRSSKILILGVVSSKVDKTKARRKNESKETIVEISPAEYAELSLPSIIDCNSPKTISLEELIEKYQSKELECCNDLDTKIIEKIIVGIKKSRLVTENIKNNIG